jgi:hypothetical protein
MSCVGQVGVSVVVVGLIGKVGVGRVFVNSWYMVGRSE